MKKTYSVYVERVIKTGKTFEVEAENPFEAEDIVRSAAKDGGMEDADIVEDTFALSDALCMNDTDYIDQYGNPYVEGQSYPAGGGLHKACDYNADALYAFNVLRDRYKIADYLLSRGFKEVLHGDGAEVWVKGNTKVVFEDYADGMWGYMHTAFITWNS